MNLTQSISSAGTRRTAPLLLAAATLLGGSAAVVHAGRVRRTTVDPASIQNMTLVDIDPMSPKWDDPVCTDSNPGMKKRFVQFDFADSSGSVTSVSGTSDGDVALVTVGSEIVELKVDCSDSFPGGFGAVEGPLANQPGVQHYKIWEFQGQGTAGCTIAEICEGQPQAASAPAAAPTAARTSSTSSLTTLDAGASSEWGTPDCTQAGMETRYVMFEFGNDPNSTELISGTTSSNTMDATLSNGEALTNLKVDCSDMYPDGGNATTAVYHFKVWEFANAGSSGCVLQAVCEGPLPSTVYDYAPNLIAVETNSLQSTGHEMPGGPPAGTDPNDLNVRFSKVRFPPALDGLWFTTGQLPLDASSYPLASNPRVYEALVQSYSPSVTVPGDIGIVEDVEEMINSPAVGGPPSHPTGDVNSDFWVQLEHVVTLAKIRRDSGVYQDASTIMELPELWEDFTIDEVAEAVHNEYPGMHQSNLLATMGSIEIDDTIIPRRSRSQFLNGIVMLSGINSWSVGVVGPTNFGAKYSVGRARPEEVVHLINTGSLTAADGVPPSLITKIHSLGIPVDDGGASFTQYTEGSHEHPSWPAMHSAECSMSLWLPVVAKLTEEQERQVKLTDHAVAYAQTVAGVHYEDDTIAGLNMGQEIVARHLAKFLAERFGADEQAVQNKVALKRFDWREFSSGTFEAIDDAWVP